MNAQQREIEMQIDSISMRGAAIVGSDVLLRDGIGALLTERAQTATAHAFASVDELLSSPRLRDIDVVLVDCVMPGIVALSSALSRLHKALPECAVVALVHQRDFRLLAPLFRWRRCACVLKEEGYSELERALGAALSGASYLSPGTSADRPSNGSDSSDCNGKSLSARETEIMQLIASGQRTREIADRLSLSPKTIEKHRANLMRKIGVRNIAGVALFAVGHASDVSPRVES